MHSAELVLACTRIAEFFANTIDGFERVCYRSRDSFGFYFQSLEMLTATSKIAHIDYYNDIHKALILKDDEYITSQFDSFKVLRPAHSPICLLNIMIFESIRLHLKIERKKCSMQSLGDYMGCVGKQLQSLQSETTQNLIQRLSHNCNGMPLETKYDPSHPMFTSGNVRKVQALCVVCCRGSSLKCGNCKTITYCSEACQKKDWKEHKTKCENLNTDKRKGKNSK